MRANFALEKNIVVMGVTSMVASFGNFLWFYFLPIYYSNLFGATPFQISIIYAAELGIIAFGSSPAGALADRYGRKKMIVVSGLISALSIFILAFSHNFLISALALPIGGLGTSFFQVTNTLLAESVPSERRGTAFGTYQTLATIAFATSPLLGGFTIAQSGFFPLFMIGGVLTLAAALARVIYLKETLHPLEHVVTRQNFISSYYRGMGTVLRSKVILALVLIYSMYNLFVDQNSFVTPLYAKTVLHFDFQALGVLFSVLLVSMAISRMVFGKLSDRIGRKKTVLISWIGEISIVYVFVFAPPGMPMIAVLGLGIWMLFGVMDSPAINAWIADVSDPSQRGLSMGTFYSVTYIPTVFTLLVTGLLFSLQPRFPFYANSLVGIVALVLLLKYAKTEKIPPDSSGASAGADLQSE